MSRRDHNGIPIIGAEAEGRAPLRVQISLPTHNVVPMGFAYDLANMCGWTAAVLKAGQVDFRVTMCEGTYIHTMRQELVERAVEADMTHILFLDTDMRFPKETLVHMLRRQVPILGINYAQRKMPPDFVAIKHRGAPKKPAEKLWTTKDSEGIEEVEGMGFGVTLLQTGIFSAMGEPPWFRMYWSKQFGRHVGEDVHFCTLAREAGIPVYVDHDLSKECAHIGQFEFECYHAQAYQEELLDADNELLDAPDGGLQLAQPD